MPRPSKMNIEEPDQQIRTILKEMLEMVKENLERLEVATESLTDCKNDKSILLV